MVHFMHHEHVCWFAPLKSEKHQRFCFDLKDIGEISKIWRKPFEKLPFTLGKDKKHLSTLTKGVRNTLAMRKRSLQHVERPNYSPKRFFEEKCVPEFATSSPHAQHAAGGGGILPSLFLPIISHLGWLTHFLPPLPILHTAWRGGATSLGMFDGAKRRGTSPRV